jgi:hypothetical protein
VATGVQHDQLTIWDLLMDEFADLFGGDDIIAALKDQRSGGDFRKVAAIV